MNFQKSEKHEFDFCSECFTYRFHFNSDRLTNYGEYFRKI